MDDFNTRFWNQRIQNKNDGHIKNEIRIEFHLFTIIQKNYYTLENLANALTFSKACCKYFLPDPFNHDLTTH
jgi:hypothetical protein